MTALAPEGGDLDALALATDIALCTSELVTNALRHTESGRDGQVRVEVALTERVIRVVDDGGGTSVPHLALAGETAVCGRGLLLVAFLTTEWGVEQREKGHAVWFEFHSR